MRFAGRHLLVLLTLILSAFPDHTSANSANDPGVTPESSAIDTTDMRVGAPVVIVYGLGIADPATGEWPRQATATGTIQAINEQRLLLAQKGPNSPQRIDLQRIKRFELDPSGPVAEEPQLHSETAALTFRTSVASNAQGSSVGSTSWGITETSTSDSSRVRRSSNLGTDKRILLKLGNGVLLGSLVGPISGGILGASFGNSLAGVVFGLVYIHPVGTALGVARIDSSPYDQFKFALSGSVIGSLVAHGLAPVTPFTYYDDLWRAWPLLVSPPVMATLLSEWLRPKPPDTRRFSIGLERDSSNSQSVRATLRF